jgi:hypothetical protein
MAVEGDEETAGARAAAGRSSFLIKKGGNRSVSPLFLILAASGEGERVHGVDPPSPWP